MTSLRLKILTPEGPVFDGAVRTVVVPATKGSMGVLPGHAPLLSPLETGVVKAVFEDASVHYFMVSGGFVEIADNEVRILADVGEEDSEINAERAKAAAERAKNRMRETRGTEFDLARAEAALARALTRLHVAELRLLRGTSAERR